ncbi:hypothetical protein FNV43_RR25202 [Rhamnella rubrinervis]|uniref:NAC domain-containing protein n=1 Tax=Rhamnella rubrinervis TaxID=2594499 RepID=A0A8K0DTR3_9ROSA|nr:hypothetical protein FNV43_RR25202 [Rhamnella rubrinervis]
MGRDSATSLAPGFRFHPTDEELVRYYLKRKVSGRPFRFDPISVVDIYKSEPWDLPLKSKLKSRDLEWYFFSALDKKYGNGSRTNRATEKGYWKTTGKDRPIRHNSQTVGMKKTLVYHSGRAPKGARSNWVMHEYRLVDEELRKAGIVQDAYVLCRIFQKSGTGPKNGEQYGAPFIEEEWEEDDELAWVPGEEVPAYEMVVGNGAVVEATEFYQNLDIGAPSEIAPVPLSFYYGETSNNVQHTQDFAEDDVKPIIGTRETSELGDEQTLFDLPKQYETNAKPAKDECVVESSNNGNHLNANYSTAEQYMDATENGNLVNANYPTSEQYLDAIEVSQFGDEFFIETNDLSNPVEADPEGFDMLDEYLTFFDADDDNSQYLTIGSSENAGNENVSEPDSFSQKNLNGETELVPSGSQHLAEANNSDEASSSKQKSEATKFESELKSSFFKQASHILGSIPAPPAFASELPTKEAALRQNSTAQSSGSIHVTAGMIRITNMTLDGSGMDWYYGKSEDVNLVLSLGLLQADVNSVAGVPLARMLSGKTGLEISRCFFFFLFIWVLIISLSFKIGSHFYTR